MLHTIKALPQPLVIPLTRDRIPILTRRQRSPHPQPHADQSAPLPLHVLEKAGNTVRRKDKRASCPRPPPLRLVLLESSSSMGQEKKRTEKV